MDLHSFISSFKIKKIFRLFIILFIFWFIDFSIYTTLFKYYNQFYNLTNMSQKSNFLLIGSSHILWDIVPQMIEESIPDYKVNMINIPGANMEIRTELFKEYLKKNPDQKINLIVLETDKYLFNSKRYPDRTYKALLPYFHKGYFNDFLIEKLKVKEGFPYIIPFIIIKSFSFNESFHFLAGKIYDLLIQRIFSIALNLFFPSDLYADEPSLVTEKNRKKIELWRKEYISLGNDIDPEMVDSFKKFISLAKDNHIKMILLETPNYDFGNDKDFEKTREIINNSLDDTIKYIRVKPGIYEKNIDLLYDASHLNQEGRVMYTKDFINMIHHSSETSKP